MLRHHRTSTAESRSAAGFSLVELVVVLAIMMVITGIAAPRYASAIDSYRVDAAARRVIADLNLAHVKARSSSQSRTVGFDLVNQTLTIPGIASLKNTGGSYTVQYAQEPYRCKFAKVTVGNVTVTPASSTPTASITFDGYGQPEAAATIVIESGGNRRTIVLNVYTGKASLQ